MNPGAATATDRLLDVVGEAWERAPAQRGAFLVEACGGDAALLAEARSLVDHGENAGEFLARPAYALLADTDPGGMEAGSLRPGEMLGECRVLSLLGEGGMGEVYLAEDTKLERRVAVKLLKCRLDDAGSVRRFRHERRVLAALTHPGIARLYGGGTTADGRSYLVMEYVEGERLDHFCDVRRFGVAERLALFRKVCAAVSHAHQNLVVHRDLKPANVRVTPEGEPKLLDFGIAKLLDPDHVTGTFADPTMTLSTAMTPEYASPEQIKGETITTGSDVYSLGIVLYELLCGQRPHQRNGRRLDELARAICEEEPPKPSIAVGKAGSCNVDGEPPARRRRRLEGDLDNIVAKALRKEPVRRYASVAQLSEDVRRHLEGLPVGARPDTFAYRAGKFARRHKAGVAAAALGLLALVGGVAATISQARRANLEAARANGRFEQVRQLAHSLLFEVEPQIEHLPGSIPARQTLVKRALEYLDNLSREAGSRRDLRRELAAAYEKVGDVQGQPNQSNLGDRKGARASYQKARGLWQSLVAADPHDAPARQGLASCDEHLGEILWWSSETAAAEQTLREALALSRELVAGQPGSLEYRHGLASVLVHLGDIPQWNAQSAEALSLYGQALPILQALARENPHDVNIGLDLARCLENTADAQKDSGDYPGALNHLTQAEGIVGPLAQRDPNQNNIQNSLWYILYSETEVLLARKETGQALEVCPRMLGIAEARYRSNPEDANSQHNLAISHEAHATALVQAQRWEEALGALQAALDIDARLVVSSSADATYLHSSGSYRLQMGQIRLRLGDAAHAQADAQAAREQLESAVRADPDDNIFPQDLIRAYELEGDLCAQRHEVTQARQWFQRALTAIKAHKEMRIAADDQHDWDTMREKLDERTKLDSATVQNR